MSEPVVLVSVESGVCHIQINRPKVKNAINFAAYSAMAQAIEAAKADDLVRVVLISGSEGNFSSGNDLADFAGGGDASGDSPVLAFMQSLYHCNKPVVAAVSGFAVGIGTTMLLHCDLVYADDSAKFVLPFNNLGLCAEYGSSYLLPRIMGRAKAMELILLGEAFSAQDAVDLGIVCSIQEDVLEVAKAKARKLATQPPQATEDNKVLLRSGTYQGAQDAMAEEFKLFNAGLKGPEFREAVTAFMEKRAPDFSTIK